LKEKPAGLRKEQLEEQQHSKLQKLNAHQNAPLQAGCEHPVSLESWEVRHQPERPLESIESNHYPAHSSQIHQKDPLDPGAADHRLNDQIHHLQSQTHLQARWQTQGRPGCPPPKVPEPPILSGEGEDLKPD